RGFRRPVSVPGDESWAAPTADEAWFRKTAADMRTLESASKSDFLAHLDSIDSLRVGTLMATGEATAKYDLPPAPPDFVSASSRISSEAELIAYAQNYVADAVLSARLRVLAWTYQYWYAERYELVEKRARP